MKFNLGTKFTLTIILVALVLSGTAVAISYSTISSMNDRHYMDKADEIAATIAQAIDASDAAAVRHAIEDEYYEAGDERVMSDEWGTEAFDEYIARFEDVSDMPEFSSIMTQLRGFQNVNDVDCLYTIYIEPDERDVVYMVDAAEEDACPPGTIDPLYDINSGVIDDITIGFPAYITDTEEYGWLVTAAAPVYDEHGDVVCYAAVDISMETVKQQETEYVRTLVLSLLALTVLICIAAALWTRRFITRPLSELSARAEEYCKPTDGQRSTFEGLSIRTHDEIEELYDSMLKMEHDIDGYIETLVQARMTLQSTREEADFMSELAHKDALTGVRNKLAYDNEVKVLETALATGDSAFGIAVIDLNDLKVINDTYGHDRGNVSLKTMSRIISSVFVHSLVFRIGGDEFAIVLRNADYEKIEETAGEFASALEAQNSNSDLQPWEKVSAALGYALYDPEKDSSVEDVFIRADAEMYANKKAFKESATK